MIIASAVMITGRRRMESGGEGGVVRVHAVLALIVGEGDDEDAVGGRHADAHDRPHQRGHAEGGAGDEQHPEDARQHTGRAMRMISGSSQDWKLMTISR